VPLINAARPSHKYFDLGSIKCFISTDLHSLAFLSWKLLLCSPSIQARVFFDAITIRFNYFCCRFVFCLSSGHSYGFREAWDGRKIVYICAIKIKNKLQLFSDKQLHCWSKREIMWVCSRPNLYSIYSIDTTYVCCLDTVQSVRFWTIYWGNIFRARFMERAILKFW